jgi:hypothetical protein
VTTQKAAGGVVVDTVLVRHEVLVDVETSFDWTVLLDFNLDGVGVGEALRAGFLDIVVLDSGAIDTFLE